MRRNYSKFNELLMNNRLIISNSICLYLRLIVTMFLSLFSSRLLLKYLGVTDFGIYSVIGGVIALCSFLSATMTNSTQRFLSYEIGKGHNGNVNRIFNMCLLTHIVIAIILLLVSETLGLWIVNTYIKVPEERLFAAHVLYHVSILILVINTISIPFTSLFVSNENMNVYATVGITASFLKLITAFLICKAPFDKLIFYGTMLVLISAFSFLTYFLLSRKKYRHIKLQYIWDKNLFKSIFTFSWWSVVGQFSIILTNNGTNILINMFHNLTANAAMGIGGQVNGAMQSLASNIQMAFKPQIVKSYASGKYEDLTKLVEQATKFAFMVIFVLAIPICLNIDLVLEFWLGTYPKYTAEFCVLFILASILNTIGAAFGNAVEATGNIRNYQLTVSAMFLSDVVIVYLLFSVGYPPIVCMIVKVILNFIVMLSRVAFTVVKIPQIIVKKLIIHVLLPIFIVMLIVLVCSYFSFILGFLLSITCRILTTIIIFTIALLGCLFIIMKKSERIYLIHLLFK